MFPCLERIIVPVGKQRVLTKAFLFNEKEHWPQQKPLFTPTIHYICFMLKRLTYAKKNCCVITITQILICTIHCMDVHGVQTQQKVAANEIFQNPLFVIDFVILKGLT